MPEMLFSVIAPTVGAFIAIAFREWRAGQRASGYDGLYKAGKRLRKLVDRASHDNDRYAHREDEGLTAEIVALKDHYAVLGVLPSIEQVGLTAIYRALLKKYHPDIFSGTTDEAVRITKELNEAYSVLGDPEKRRTYDQQRQQANTKA